MDTPFEFPETVRSLAEQVMADGQLDFKRDAQLLTQIIDALFQDARERLLAYLPAVTGQSLVTLITQQMLALDDEYSWDAPGIGEAQEDQLLTWLVERRVRQLIPKILGEPEGD